MRTRSQSRNLHNQQHQAPPPVVEPFNLEEPFENPPPPPPPMDDQRTMAQLLEAPTAGYEDAHRCPEINADNFELIHGLLNLPGFGLKRTPSTIQTWDDLVSKFINKFFPPSKTTNLRNEITRFQQRFDETFYEAWDRFNDLLRACPHHGFSELHQLDTFYNALNSNDQDSLNSAAGGNFLDKMPRDCLRIIESKSKVHNSRNKPVVAKVELGRKATFHPENPLPDIVLLAVVLIPTKLVQPLLAMFIEIISKNMSLKQPQLTTTKETPVIEPRFQIKFDHPVFLPFKTINVQNQGNNQNRYNQTGDFNQAPAYQSPVHQGQIYRPQVVQPPAYQAPAYQAPAPQIQGVSKEDFHSYVKANDAVMRNMQTQGQNMQNQLNNLATSNQRLESMLEDLKGITTRSGVAYKGPTIPITSSPKVMERDTEVTKDTMPPTNNGSTKDVPPPVVPIVHHESISDPQMAPVSASRHKPKSINSIFLQERNDEDVVRS
ncbi:reverse transcriptase domain-containing protein [Tanacetum coccineum]|uniref:Reverse transcriptase domain-containing protein n=1 Tax=Tanacetum coccineum TaxID=301880 RepID=A0ABQ4ZNT6_9ASTR